MIEKLKTALDGISDRHIDEAAKRRPLLRPRWLGATAAVLAAVILVSAFLNPVTAKAVSLADYSKGDRTASGEVHNYMDLLIPFWTESMTQVLSDAEDNRAFSPINLYMALSALAEMTESDQILEALGMDSLDTLRSRTAKIWNVSYRDSGDQTLLASSLWLDDQLTYDQAVMDALAAHHYTSVYQCNFGTARTDRDIANWLDQQTGNLLKNTTANIRHSEDILFALYSTIFYQAKWHNEFKASQNTQDIFHTPGGDVEVTYMNKDKITGFYFWGEDFGAISLGLKDGSRMWLILPDEGKTVSDVVSAGEYLKMFLGNEVWDNCKDMYINLSLPKFDIRSNSDLKGALKAMGITDVFDPDSAGFGSTFPGFDGPIWADSVNQATRVAIDEKGVTAASYIEIPGAGAAAPPEDTIDFILDRPFLFVVTNHAKIPLFAGVVNAP